MTPSDAEPRRVGDLGEFELIRRLSGRRGHARDDVVAGIGDDTAALRSPAGGDLLLATCDVQVAGVHFPAAGADPRRLGRKAVAINVSDVAASGGRPAWLVSSLLLPPDTEVAFVEALYDGLDEEARRWEVAIVGGNVSRAGTLAVDLTLIGEVAPGERLARDGARPGDLVLVTGVLGGAAAGLHLVQHPDLDVPRAVRCGARDALELPDPRLPEGRALARSGAVTSAIDLSDGLAADLLHVCEASGTGVRLDLGAVPVHPAASEVARRCGVDASSWALAGGEAYELLFTTSPQAVERVAAMVAAERGIPATVIGEIVPAERGCTLVGSDGTRRPLERGGWRHF